MSVSVSGLHTLTHVACSVVYYVTISVCLITYSNISNSFDRNTFFHPLQVLRNSQVVVNPNLYHPRMRIGNNFSRVCLCVCVSVCVSVCPSVCLSVCLSVCVSVQMITFEPLMIGTSFLVHTYIFIISRSSLSTKVIGSRSRSND